MKIFLSVILLFIQVFVSGQSRLEGIVLDSITRQPVSYATVYINGTTKGTLTDHNGRFIFNHVELPVMLVVRHLSYSHQALIINSKNFQNLTIKLLTKIHNLSQVKVEDSGLRKNNKDIFKRMFIGDDFWGRNAILSNDSVLTFSPVYSYHKVIVNDSVKKEIKLGFLRNIEKWSSDSSCILVKDLSVFTARANAPLIIDMPLLGYILQVDLVDFKIQYTGKNSQCEFLGYYFFKPYKIKSKNKARKYDDNRKLAYFNSSQHFLRSFYEKRLEQNGYKLREAIRDSITGKIKYFMDVEIDSLAKQGNGLMQISGLKNRKLYVFFYYKNNGIPVDLTMQKKTLFYRHSGIYFLKDTCTITREGIIPDNNIMFDGDLSTKKVGSYLPDDYGSTSEALE